MIRFLEVLFESEKLPESCGLAAKIPKQQKGENPNVMDVPGGTASTSNNCPKTMAVQCWALPSPQSALERSSYLFSLEKRGKSSCLD